MKVSSLAAIAAIYIYIYIYKIISLLVKFKGKQDLIIYMQDKGWSMQNKNGDTRSVIPQVKLCLFIQ